MPMARIAVMGAAGKEFVYKSEIRKLDADHRKAMEQGQSAQEADQARDEGLALLTDRYERDLMNPKEALSLGSVSSLVTPGESRRVLADNLSFLIRHYEPTPMGGVQREHE